MTTIMRVDLNPGSGVEGAQTSEAELGRISTTARASSRDNFTEFETSVGKLADIALNAPEVRQAKVQSLKAQVEVGTYYVSDSDVAGSILEQLRVRT